MNQESIRGGRAGREIKIRSPTTITGREFYGFILTVFDPDGRVLLCRFSPQALYRDASKPHDGRGKGLKLGKQEDGQ